MMNKFFITCFLILFILLPFNICLGQNTNNIFSQSEMSDFGIEQPEFPVNTITTSQSTPSNTVPTISELKTVVDKALADEEESKDWSTPVKLVIIFSGLAILPSLLIMMTSFTRIVIVLSFVRRALTTQTIPPTIAIIGLALFLTLYTMTPTFAKINESAIKNFSEIKTHHSFIFYD